MYECKPLVTGSTTNGKELSAEDLDKTVVACDRNMELDTVKKTLVTLVESRMDKTAPNLSAVLGPEVAARLMGVAGGQGLTLVHLSAQLEPCLTIKHPTHPKYLKHAFNTGYTTPMRTPYPIQSAQVELRSERV